ncbi:Six-hairpin glycosidase-like protein [Hypomontagnella submonticulosa]|nr:Six-hairpin glycosidase-like protein [Hypomontagnella submonticulosa]
MAKLSYKTFSLSALAGRGGSKSQGDVDVLPQYTGDENSVKGKRDNQPSSADYLLLKVVASFSAIGIVVLLVYNILVGRASVPLEYTEHAGHTEHAESSGTPGFTSFLDRETPISAFAGKTFLKDNIPFIDIPDSLIQDVYYYRWTSIQRNLRYIKEGTGYMCTEFVHPVGYAKAFGSIDAAAGHQIDESRWLRDTSYGDDYIQLYTRGPADALQYTQWILDAASRRADVTGDLHFFASQVDDMVRLWHQWDHVYDKAAGLYYYQPVWDAQELSLPGFIADPNGTDWDLRKDGPDTFRPSHNAYMVANARAISRAAALAYNESVAFEFSKVANDLEHAMYERLWAPEQRFFMDVIRPNNPNLTRLTGREQVGLFPYRFGIGLERKYAQPAVDSMFDPQGFLAPYGPTTLEIRDPWFFATRPDDYCCYWNGMSWPYSTGHTLKSLAAIYRSGTTNVTADQYVQYLRTYARTQMKNGQPYVAESHYPFTDGWSADGWNHSEHYDHSTNNDDVITGLFGIQPQQDDRLVISPIVPDNWTYYALENLPYHGHNVTVLYDEKGSKYRQGKGLIAFVDGKNVEVHRVLGSPKQSYWISVPSPPRKVPADAWVNIAANPTGPGQYPMADATYTNAGDYQFKAIDGVLYYDTIPDNRWTNYRSPNLNDTLTITFARPRKMSSVTLAIFSDVARGGGIDVPSRIEVYGSNGVLAIVDDHTTLLRNDRNTISFGREVETQFLAVNMYRQQNLWVGICELEVWVPPEIGPTYHAADAYLTGGKTSVIYDNSSIAEANGPVAVSLGSDSNVAFSGIMSKGGKTGLWLNYANAGNKTVDLSVEVNQVPRDTVRLGPTGRNFRSTKKIYVPLAAGKNYVSLRGGSDSADVRLQTLTVS